MQMNVIDRRKAHWPRLLEKNFRNTADAQEFIFSGRFADVLITSLSWAFIIWRVLDLRFQILYHKNNLEIFFQRFHLIPRLLLLFLFAFVYGFLLLLELCRQILVFCVGFSICVESSTLAGCINVRFHP